MSHGLLQASKKPLWQCCGQNCVSAIEPCGLSVQSAGSLVVNVHGMGSNAKGERVRKCVVQCLVRTC